MTDKIKEAMELVDYYAEEHWWFDPDLVIHDSMNALLAERGRLQAENERLRKIATHVPGKIYIEAKEKAGFPNKVSATALKEQT